MVVLVFSFWCLFSVITANAGPVTIKWFVGVPIKSATKTVVVGTKVSWVWKDKSPHSVKDANTTRDIFQGPGGGNNVVVSPFTYTFTFTTPGVYKYYCKNHRTSMKGAITVKAPKPPPSRVTSPPMTTTAPPSTTTTRPPPTTVTTPPSTTTIVPPPKSSAVPLPTSNTAPPPKSITVPPPKNTTKVVSIKWWLRTNFDSASVTIKVGDRVDWIWSDNEPHDLIDTDFSRDAFTGDGGRGSYTIAPFTYSYTFTKAGVYEFICGLHDKMTGVITVEN